jgi:hypothetical protein
MQQIPSLWGIAEESNKTYVQQGMNMSATIFRLQLICSRRSAEIWVGFSA